MRKILLFKFLITLSALLYFVPGHAQSKQDYKILFSSYQFDPLEQMPDIPDSLKIVSATEDKSYQIIQLQHSPNRQEIEMLSEEYGLKLDQLS